MQRAYFITALLLLTLVVSLFFGAVQAEDGISTPSTPEFTLERVDASYDVPTTYSIDPYTGENFTHFGYHVEKNALQAVIENNLGVSYYTFRYKPHYSDEWSYYPLNPEFFGNYNFYDAYSVPCQASTSDYSVIPLTFLPWYEGGKVDVQAQALFGNFDAAPFGHPAVPMPAPTYDFYFNGTASDWSETVTFAYDLTPPHVSILFPKPQEYFNSNVDLTFSVNEQPYQIMYSIDGEEKTTILGNTTLTGLPYGSHNIIVYTWDEAGNVGISQMVTFTITNIFQVVIVVAIIVAVVVGGAGLLIYDIRKK